MRPSSKASLEAAASSTPSVDSHPPFGTEARRIAAASGGGRGGEQTVSCGSTARKTTERGEKGRRGVGGEEQDEKAAGRALTDPAIWPFPACDEEDLASGAGDGNGAADDAGGGAALVAHCGVRRRRTAVVVVRV